MMTRQSSEYRPPVYQVSEHMRPPETWTLTLNRYQRDNLLNFIERAMKGDERPVGWFNTGDWIGEICWMLGKTYYDAALSKTVTVPYIDENDKPNPVRQADSGGAEGENDG